METNSVDEDKTGLAMNEQQHLLVCLMEECGEVVQACSKALRFGMDDDHQAANPDIVSPRLYIRKELNDLVAVADLLEMDWMDERLIDAKKTKLEGFMEYAYSRGTLIFPERDSDTEKVG
jgi:NTP pyrophosphatase (non-canonical NTP hydrolase)